MRVALCVEALAWVGVWWGVFLAAAQSDAARCAAGCKEVKAQFARIGEDTCLAYSDGLQALSLKQAENPNMGMPTPTTGQVTMWRCPSCPEVCDNNPLDPSRELAEPTDWKKCEIRHRVTRYDCLGAGS
ncbi:MAG: hypothetical protein K6T86_17730 [Pirellulales bacterium]|nr:hypothetical protein [Pirellulales bacterium]